MKAHGDFTVFERRDTRSTWVGMASLWTWPWAGVRTGVVEGWAHLVAKLSPSGSGSGQSWASEKAKVRPRPGGGMAELG